MLSSICFPKTIIEFHFPTLVLMLLMRKKISRHIFPKCSFFSDFQSSVYVCVTMASCATFVLQCPLFTAVFIWMVHGRSYVYIQHACFFVSISVFLPCWSALFNSAPLSFSLYAFFEVNLKDQHQSFISYKRACCLLM